ncbi:hypothetical protein ALP75_205549 [Pseudomonas syringae pv. actinidiae]|nr:hypothetical protein ALP75_205549 [Pseudomonas syringae pv. actinidiae]
MFPGGVQVARDMRLFADQIVISKMLEQLANRNQRFTGLPGVCQRFRCGVSQALQRVFDDRHHRRPQTVQLYLPVVAVGTGRQVYTGLPGVLDQWREPGIEHLPKRRLR